MLSKYVQRKTEKQCFCKTHVNLKYKILFVFRSKVFNWCRIRVLRTNRHRQVPYSRFSPHCTPLLSTTPPMHTYTRFIHLVAPETQILRPKPPTFECPSDRYYLRPFLHTTKKLPIIHHHQHREQQTEIPPPPPFIMPILFTTISRAYFDDNNNFVLYEPHTQKKKQQVPARSTNYADDHGSAPQALNTNCWTTRTQLRRRTRQGTSLRQWRVFGLRPG